MEELPIAKSPIVAVKIKPDELDEDVPPKTECWASSILKLSDDKLVPFEISPKAKLGKSNAAIKIKTTLPKNLLATI